MSPDQKHSLLIVDDDESFRTILARTLCDEGFAVETAPEGRSAVEFARKRQFDIVLLDVKMPVMDGLEALKILRKESPATDYMMLTGVNDVSLAVEAIKLGAREYLTKPFEPERLIQQIRTTLRARAAEEKLHEIESNFSSRLLYDLRTPINALNTGIGFLLREMAGPLSDQQRVVLSHLGDNTQKLVALLNDMIDLTKLESGRVGLEKMAANFDQILPPLIEQYQAAAAAKKISIVTRISPTIPTLSLDIGKIGQVVTNLLDNAIKFTADGGTITIALITSHPEPNHPAREFIELSVSDTGPGIGPDELPFVFDKYKELLTGKPSIKKTTGLGLAICRRIVEAHHGRMIVESETGNGTTFTVLLPVEE